MPLILAISMPKSDVYILQIVMGVLVEVLDFGVSDNDTVVFIIGHFLFCISVVARGNKMYIFMSRVKILD